MARSKKNIIFEETIKQLIDNKKGNTKAISVSLPESLINDLDFIANELTDGNRSLLCEKGLTEFVAACKTLMGKSNLKSSTDPKK